MASSGPSKRKAAQYVDKTNTTSAATQEDQSPHKRNAAVPQPDVAVPQPAAAVPHPTAEIYKNAAEKGMLHNLEKSITAAANATAAAAVSAMYANTANALPESDRNRLPISPDLMYHLAHVAKNAAAQASTLFRRIAESTANAGSATSSQVTLGYVAAATINAQSAVNQSEFAVAVSEIIHMALYMNK